jgi:ribose transport system ATP-binding protein
MVDEDRKVVLRTSGLSKSFPGVQAYQDIDYELLEGEIHCLVGENGAGKSTFIKTLTGVLTPDRGTIVLGDDTYTHVTPKITQRHGIQTVFQEIELAPPLSVAENLFIGNEKTLGTQLIDYRKTYRLAAELIEEFDFRIDVRKELRELSLAEQEIIQIIKAVSRRPRVLILDEATATFSQKEIQDLISLVKDISRRGVSVIYISHHLEEVFNIADRITVLRDGRKIGCFHKNDLNMERLITLIVGKEAESFYEKRDHKVLEDRTLRVSGYRNRRFFDSISFDLHAGEVVGLAGPIGSGKTELARAIFAVDREGSGRLYRDGREITPRSPKEAIARHLCFLTEDKREDGLYLQRPVHENITSAGLQRFRGPLINLSAERRLTSELIDRLEIKTTSHRQLTKNLSGGNQQKVVLAKWFFVEPDIYIFDEPTLGVDVGAKQEIYKIISGLADTGKFILIISSDLMELATLCDRVLIMKKRRIVAEVRGKDVSEEKILRLIVSDYDLPPLDTEGTSTT